MECSVGTEQVHKFVSYCQVHDRAEKEAWESAAGFSDDKLVGKISRAYKKILSVNGDCLKDLIGHHEEAVRYWASACSLQARVMTDLSRRAMEDISENSDHPTRRAKAQAVLLYFDRLQ